MPATTQQHAHPSSLPLDFAACYRAIAGRDTRWDVREDLAARAVRRIRDGAIDSAGVSGLARELAVSERLHRVLVEEVGAGADPRPDAEDHARTTERSTP